MESRASISAGTATTWDRTRSAVSTRPHYKVFVSRPTTTKRPRGLHNKQHMGMGMSIDNVTDLRPCRRAKNEQSRGTAVSATGGNDKSSQQHRAEMAVLDCPAKARGLAGRMVRVQWCI